MYIIKPIPVNISLPIRELLLHYHKAVIPGFGTFILLHHPALLNKTNHMLTPPYKEIKFVGGQQADDEQLSGYLVQKLKISQVAATKAIADFLKTAEIQLGATGNLFLEDLGTLVRNKTGEVIFKPDEELLKRISLFELPKLDIQPATTVSQPVTAVHPPIVPPPVTSTISTERPVERPTFTYKKKRRWWIPAALFALFIGLAVTLYFTGLYDNFRDNYKAGKRNAAGIDEPERLVFGNPATAEVNEEEADTLKEKISRELDARTARENALSYKEAETKPKAVTESESSTPQQAAAMLTGKPYHIIAGAFMVPNNAERQKTQLELKGFAPVLLPKRRDYFMVSLGAYDTHEQAVMAMKKLRGQLKQELWVMKI